jgi:hypothetical protein
MNASAALVRRWVELLDPIVRDAAAGGDDPAAGVARALLDGTPACVPLSDPRPDIATLLDYVRSADRVAAIDRCCSPTA